MTSKEKSTVKDMLRSEDEEPNDAWWETTDGRQRLEIRMVDGARALERVVHASTSEKPKKKKREGGKDHEKKGHESKCSVHSRRLKRMNRQK